VPYFIALLWCNLNFSLTALNVRNIFLPERNLKTHPQPNAYMTNNLGWYRLTLLFLEVYSVLIEVKIKVNSGDSPRPEFPKITLMTVKK
jgi:hypothetical protein